MSRPEFDATSTYMRVVSAVVIPLLAAVFVWQSPGFAGHLVDLVSWIACAVVSDLLLVRTGKTVTLSMSLPVTLAAAMVLSPPEAALVAFVGCVTTDELRGRVPLHRMLFNRGQVAMAVLAAAAVFQLDSAAPTEIPDVLFWSLLALATDFAVNAAFMLPLVARDNSASVREAVLSLFGSRPLDTVLLYVAMGLLAPSIAILYLSAGPAVLVVALVPAILGHVSLARSQHLGSLLSRLEAKDAVIRRMTERVRVERAEERATLANELHDDVIPALFRTHLLGQVVEKDLHEGKLLELEEDVRRLVLAVGEAQASARAFIGGLRSSPLGSRGLVSAIQTLVDDLQIGQGPKIRLTLEPTTGTHTAQLIVFFVVREALRNACQHSRATEVAVRVMNEEGRLRAVVRDDGVGFEPMRVLANGHFGLRVIRETAEAAGGTLVVDSGLGAGTTVVVAVPPDA